MRRSLTSTSTVQTTATARERRSLPRMRFDHPVTCRPLDGRDPFVAHGRSLSGSGVQLVTDARLEIGALFELTIEPPLPGPPALKTVVEVVRVEAAAEGDAWHVAGRFTSPL